MEEITKDPRKHYIESEPVFLQCGISGEVHILRPANEDEFGNTITPEGGD